MPATADVKSALPREEGLSDAALEQELMKIFGAILRKSEDK